VANDEEWQAFGNVIGNPDWSKDPKFATPAARKENENELDQLIEGWTINHTAEDVAVLMQQARVPAALVQNAEDLFHDPQFKHRQAFVELDHREIGTYHISTAAFRSSRYSNTPRFPAPLMGEHNEYVLREFLGMSNDEIADLVADEALQ
jgi:crotonobetainyl-CoA:carnitine CoA-transferase CaiB-like acyl-CoA transferase